MPLDETPANVAGVAARAVPAPVGRAGRSVLPPAAWLTALAGLPGVGPARLLALYRADGAEGAWQRVLRGDAGSLPELDGRLGPDPVGLVRRWSCDARQVDVRGRWAAHAAAGVDVVALGSPEYPAALAEDPEPPAVVFMRGHREALELPSVAVVGTRGCTRAGRDIATELGHDLAAAGVAVVSGLALGIDGASHRGALDAAADLAAGATAPPVGVVANGLDVSYPKRHAGLQREVERRGVVVSEAPLGTPPEPWRFPARNRIIAGLARAVVVVESRETGGSMHTADEALERGITVLAVPGSVRSPASAGTNHLLAAGAAVARDVDDVLATIGMAGRRPAAGRTTAPAASGPPGRRPRRAAPVSSADPEARSLLDTMDWQPVTFEQLVARSGWSMGTVAAVVARLEADGAVSRTGGWLERVGGRDG